MILEKIRIRNQLIIIVAVLMSGLFVYGIVSYFTLQTIRIKGPYYNKIILSKDLIADILPPPAYIIEAYLTAFQEYAAHDKEELGKLIEQSQRLEKEYLQAQARWSENLPDGHLKEIFTVQSDALVRSFFSTWQNQFLPAITAGEKEKAYKVLTGPLTLKYRDHRAIIDEVVRLAKEQNQTLEEEVSDVYNKATVIGLTTWVITVLLGGFIAWYLLRSLTSRLLYMSKELESISSEVDSSVNEQEKATTQQSASVNETTTTMDELNASFQHTQAIAQESSDRAKNALKVCDDGNIILKNMVEGLSIHRDKVAQIVEHISRLSQLTRQIHNIASLTSNLTNQTNILALNAAVQAAHVKQYGEGFSVIAGEIRKLADESKKFLSHIDVLSENIQQATDSTIKIVEEGNKTIKEIIQLAQSSSHSFESIMVITNSSFEGAEQTSLNVKQQGIAVHQVLEAMEHLTESTQLTVHGVKQIQHEVMRLNKLTHQIRNDI